ncbi:hypothetical protein CLV71_105591 [Actinophytocola oryzae]|uniref:Uncharacterized protein n=1 Tax=Actinophytocola oryzae TaxID=502181 RepID=A0A4R7VSU6_9PSEU|nr:hypothetical protein CLV71_105591 [Actinophytocola oryzae]
MNAWWGETGTLIESATRGGRSAPVRHNAGRAVIVMVPDYLVGRWETAYEAYKSASALVDASTPGDAAAAEQMAHASDAVAAAWRDIAGEADLSWWSTAAVTTAAQAFEHQAQDWAARARHGRQSAVAGDGRRRRPAYPVAVRNDQVGGVTDAG